MSFHDDNGLATPQQTSRFRSSSRASSSYVDLDERQGQTQCLCYKGTVSKNNWDIWIGFLIIYTGIMAPYRLSFNTVPHGFLFWFELSMDLFFLIDLTISFNTAFQDPDTKAWITDRFQIAKRYLQGWFWIDAPASIPVDGIEFIMKHVLQEEMDAEEMHTLRLLRLLRLARVIRLLKIGSVLDALEESFGINLGWMKIVKMGFTLAYITHAFGCMWHAVGRGYHEQYGISWISDYHGVNPADVEIAELYMSSVYWAMTTLTTVGYGDICPTNVTETYFTMGTFLMGVVCFGYLMGSVGGIIDSLDKKSVQMQDRMGYVKQYIEYRKFPAKLGLRLRHYYQNFYDKSAYLYGEEELLRLLTPGLRHRAEGHILDKLLNKISFFSQFPVWFNQALLPHFQQSEVRPGDIVFTRGDESRSIYFIDSGEMGLFTHSSEISLFTVGWGEAFGEDAMVGGRRPFMAKCEKACKLVSIPGPKINEIRAAYPEVGKQIGKQFTAITLSRQSKMFLALHLLISAKPKGDFHRSALLIQLCWFKWSQKMRMNHIRECQIWGEEDSETVQDRLKAIEKKLRKLHEIPKLENKINDSISSLKEIVQVVAALKSTRKKAGYKSNYKGS